MKTYIAPEIETIEMVTCSVIAESPKSDLKVQKDNVTDDEVSFSTSAKRDDIWKYMEQ
jgi:hypothetical protein